jgi:ribosomal protein S27E
METKAGMRVRCETCGSELIVVKPGTSELTCCGKPVTAIAPGGTVKRPGA